KPRIAFLVSAAVIATARRPVVADLMVVPLREHRHLGVEGAEVIVEPVVSVVAAKLRQAVRDRGFLFGDNVAPDFAVWKPLRGRYRAIRIDVVAGMDEEVRTIVEHGAIGPISAAADIDAPALARGIAGPDERDRRLVGRRGAEAPDPALSGDAGADVFEPHA